MTEKENKIVEFIDTTKLAFKEIGYARKRDTSLKVKVKIMHDNYTTDTYDATITENRKYLLIDKLGLNRICPRMWDDDKEGKLIYMSENFHNEPDLEKMKEIESGEIFDALMMLKDKDRWLKFHIKTKGTLNWLIFNNPISYDFAHDTYGIIRNPAFGILLKETPNWKLLLIALTCFFFGSGLGFFSSTLIHIVLDIILLLT